MCLDQVKLEDNQRPRCLWWSESFIISLFNLMTKFLLGFDFLVNSIETVLVGLMVIFHFLAVNSKVLILCSRRNNLLCNDFDLVSCKLMSKWPGSLFWVQQGHHEGRWGEMTAFIKTSPELCWHRLINLLHTHRWWKEDSLRSTLIPYTNCMLFLFLRLTFSFMNLIYLSVFAAKTQHPSLKPCTLLLTGPCSKGDRGYKLIAFFIGSKNHLCNFIF